MLLQVFMCLCTSVPEPVSVRAPAVVSERNPIRMKAAVINLIRGPARICCLSIWHLPILSPPFDRSVWRLRSPDMQSLRCWQLWLLGRRERERESSFFFLFSSSQQTDYGADHLCVSRSMQGVVAKSAHLDRSSCSARYCTAHASTVTSLT